LKRHRPTHNDLPAPALICGLPIRPLDQQQLIETLITRAQRRIRTCVHYLNTHTFNISTENANFYKILTTSDLLYADGMSVVWAGRWLGHRIPERLSAADYFELFCRRCANENVKLFLLGGLDGVSETTAEYMAGRVPALQIAGTHHGYFKEEDSPKLVNRINASGADILLIGMGSPRQEAWVARYAESLTIPVLWTVGALFDYFARAEPRAPQWLCRCGAEWVYRLFHRPNERWKRYLFGNTRFLWRVLQEWVAGTPRHSTK